VVRGDARDICARACGGPAHHALAPPLATPSVSACDLLGNRDVAKVVRHHRVEPSRLGTTCTYMAGQRAGGVGFLRAGARPATAEAMSAFIDEHRSVFGVEPICRALQIAPSTYYAVCARRRRPAPRTLRDQDVPAQIRRVHAASSGLYGARKVWWAVAGRRRERGALHDRAADAPGRPNRRGLRQALPHDDR
jgi:hypothetical protein